VERLVRLIEWIGYVIAAIPPIGALAWIGWDGYLRPLLIPAAEIERLATELRVAHGVEAEEMAFREEDSAWRRSQAFEQGKWRRVRLALRDGPTN
jgi:hypothetical protein